MFEAVNGVYTFEDQVVPVEDIQSVIDAYREPGRVCVEVSE